MRPLPKLLRFWHTGSAHMPQVVYDRPLSGHEIKESKQGLEMQNILEGFTVMIIGLVSLFNDIL